MLDDPLCEMFEVLAEPLRRNIILKIASQPASIDALSEAFDVGSDLLAKELRRMEEAGLIAAGPNQTYGISRRVRVEYAGNQAKVQVIAEDQSVITFVTSRVGTTR